MNKIIALPSRLPQIVLTLAITLVFSGCSVPQSVQTETPKATEIKRDHSPIYIQEVAPQTVPMMQPSPIVEAKQAVNHVQVTGSSHKMMAAAPPLGQLKLSKPNPADIAHYQEPNTAKYPGYEDNPWKRVAEDPVSTFSADVDTASYANIRRFLQRGELPPQDAVRAEELINYFDYDYAPPKSGSGDAFSVHTHIAAAPWAPSHQLIRIAIKGKDVAKENLPPANLVFLVDVSGSMSPPDRLPLVKSALKLLSQQLRAQDKVSLVSYANGTRVVLTPTSGDNKVQINAAIDSLAAGGGTNGEAGIKLAYALAQEAKIESGINRVLLATDGDLNIGVYDPNELKALVERERKSGISLSTLGVGSNNYNDALMKKLADHGDGSYHYLDSLQEAHKVLVNEMTSTLAVIAQDLKLQVEFNPQQVQEYRLIGYELRKLKREDFNNDQVDAGDIGAGHSVTALYEIVPHGAKPNIDPLRYQDAASKKSTAHTKASAKEMNKEVAWLKLRYKKPGESKSNLLEVGINSLAAHKPNDQGLQSDKVSNDTDFRFAAAVAAWAQWLRGSTSIAHFGPQEILALAKAGKGADPYGRRGEFIQLVELSKALHPATAAGKSTQQKE